MTVTRAHDRRPIILALFVLVGVVYVIETPGYDVPDESDHLRYIQAFAEQGWVHPIDRADPLRWGYEVVQPPLYYFVMGLLARGMNPEFPGTIVVNQRQNPHMMFIRHDIEADRFPFQSHWRWLRVFRLLSLLVGCVCCWLLFGMFEQLSPGWGELLTAGFMFLPNSLQMFTSVGNDAWMMLSAISVMRLTLAIPHRAHRPGFWWGYGFLLAMGLATKINFVLVAVPAGICLAYHALDRGVRLDMLRKGWRMVIPVWVVNAPLLAAHHLAYGDWTGQNLARYLMPSFSRTESLAMVDLVQPVTAELGKTLLVNLGYGVIRLEWLSLGFFVLWLILIAFGLARVIQDLASGRRPPLALVIAAASVLVVFLFSLYINRDMMNTQIRHSWFLFAMSLAGVRCIPRPSPRAAWVLIAALCVLNAYVLVSFHQKYRQPLDGTDGDRSYWVFQSYLLQDHLRAQGYLKYGNTYFADARDALAAGDWGRAYDMAVAAMAQDQGGLRSRFMAAEAALHLGRLDQVESWLDPHRIDDPRVYALYARYLLAAGEDQRFAAYLQRVLPKAPPELRAELESIRVKRKAP